MRRRGGSMRSDVTKGVSMRAVHRSILVVACIVAAAVPASTKDHVQGYLAANEFDVTSVLEPAPRVGDPRYETDRRIFRATRHLAGTPRWHLATTDVETSTAALLRDYSCAVGVDLTPQNAPKLVALVQRAGVDTSAQTGHAKDLFARQRPFMIDHGPVCQPEAELFDKKQGHMSYDYPSGHTTWGWTWALILTAIAPDRAQQILRRGRAYGDSRFVCGAHNESAGGGRDAIGVRHDGAGIDEARLSGRPGGRAYRDHGAARQRYDGPAGVRGGGRARRAAGHARACRCPQMIPSQLLLADANGSHQTLSRMTTLADRGERAKVGRSTIRARAA